MSRHRLSRGAGGARARDPRRGSRTSASSALLDRRASTARPIPTRRSRWSSGSRRNRADEVAASASTTARSTGRPSCSAKAYARGAPRRLEDHRACRRVRLPVAQCRDRASSCCRSTARPRLHDRRQSRSRAPLCRARHRLHRRADQLLLHAYATARALGRIASDPPHAGTGSAGSIPIPTIPRCTKSRRARPGN